MFEGFKQTDYSLILLLSEDLKSNCLQNSSNASLFFLKLDGGEGSEPATNCSYV